MKHPITEASDNAKYFTKYIRHLAKRALNTLESSVQRHAEMLEEITEESGNPIPSTLQSKWKEEVGYLESWASWLEELKRSPSNNVITKQKALEYCEALVDISKAVALEWEILSESCASGKSVQHDSPFKDRYTQRCLSQKTRIEEDLLSDAAECLSKLKAIDSTLESFGHSDFSLNLNGCYIRLDSMKNYEDSGEGQGGEDPYGAIEGVEWYCSEGNRLSTEDRVPPSLELNLKNCKFSNWALSKSTFTRSMLRDMVFEQCSGAIHLNTCSSSVDVIKGSFKEIDLGGNQAAKVSLSGLSAGKVTCSTPSGTEFMDIEGSIIDSIDVSQGRSSSISLKNSDTKIVSITGESSTGLSCSIEIDKTTAAQVSISNLDVDSFKASASTFTLHGDTANIESMSLNNSKVSIQLNESTADKVVGTKGLAYVKTINSNIGEMEWDECNGWIISHGNTTADDSCRVTSGHMESYALEDGCNCQMIFDRSYPSRPQSQDTSLFEKIGRILNVLEVSLYDQENIHLKSKDQVDQIRLFWLITKGVSPDDTILKSILAKSENRSLHKSLMVSFKELIISTLTSSPSKSSAKLNDLSDDEAALVLQILNDGGIEYNPISSTDDPATLDLDAVFSKHLLDVSSILGGEIKERKFQALQNEISSILKKNKGECGPDFILQLLFLLLNVGTPESESKRSCGDVMVGYLTTLIAWYLNINLKAEKSISSLSRLVSSQREEEGDMESLGLAFRHKSPITSTKKISAVKETLLGDQEPQNYTPVEAKLASTSWDELSGESLHEKRVSLALEHVEIMLKKYKPIFSWLPAGRKKLKSIGLILGILRDDSTNPNLLDRADKLRDCITYLLGGEHTEQGSDLSPYHSLHLGRSRSQKGYKAILFFASKMLKHACEDSMFTNLEPEKAQKARKFIYDRLSTKGKIERAIINWSHQTISDRLSQITSALRSLNTGQVMSIKSEKIPNVSIDAQLRLSKILEDDLHNIGNWDNLRIEQLVLVWFSHQQYKNPTIQKVERVDYRRGVMERIYMDCSNNKHSQPVNQGIIQKLGDLISKRISHRQSIFPIEAKKTLGRHQHGI